MTSELPDSTEGIVWEYDLSANRHIHIGAQMTRILGYSPDDWVGRDWQYRLDHVHPDDRERVALSAEQIFWHDEEGELVYRFRALDGHYVWLYDTITMTGDWATERHVLGVSIETAGPGSMDQFHGEAQQGKFQVSTGTGLDVGSLANEFNDILTAIHGFAELAAANQHVRGDAKLALYLDEIRKSGLRGSELLLRWANPTVAGDTMPPHRKPQT